MPEAPDLRNTRNQAHELVAELSQRLTDKGWPVYLHIGILARGERERVERAMKYERRGICVATSTLEVGIDIGDVDVIALLSRQSRSLLSCKELDEGTDAQNAAVCGLLLAMKQSGSFTGHS